MFRAVGLSGTGETGVRGVIAITGDLRVKDGLVVVEAVAEMLRESLGLTTLAASMLVFLVG